MEVGVDSRALVAAWIREQHPWIREAARIFRQKGELSEADFEHVYEILKNPQPKPSHPSNLAELSADSERSDHRVSSVSLISISQIQGINQLAPTNPLTFPDAGLIIIYGPNGSGKSGYAKLIRAVSQAGNDIRILADVFKQEAVEQRCTVTFIRDGKQIERRWNSESGPITELEGIDVFHNGTGLHYIDMNSELSFVPEELTLFKNLVELSRRLDARLATEESQYPNLLPQVPSGLQGSMLAARIADLRTGRPVNKNVFDFAWLEEDEAQLSKMQEMGALADPRKEAERLQRLFDFTESLRAVLSTRLSKVTASKIQEINDARTRVARLREAAQEGVKHLSGELVFNGIGTETWKALWEAARRYSTEFAYPDQKYPVISLGSNCVLCHQPLQDAGVKRMVLFDDYVKSDLELQVAHAEAKLASLISYLPEKLNPSLLREALEASGLPEELAQRVILAHEDIDRVADQIKLKLPFIASTSMHDKLIDDLHALAVNVKADVSKLEAMASESTRETELRSLKELEAKKWCSENMASIKAEISRQLSLKRIKHLRSNLGTGSISRKASEVSDRVLSEAYIARFNAELAELRAKWIQVEAVKSGGRSGKVLHSVKLSGSIPAKAADVLSEGEQRVVALASFLADVTGRVASVPFVFDDPVSSLDESFEDAVAKRLAKLSLSRQVIVFTHRLSFVFSLREAAKSPYVDGKCKILEIGRMGDRTGEPVESSFEGRSVDAKFCDKLSSRIEKVKRLWQEGDTGGGRSELRAICTEFRIFIESLVEKVLLNEVVVRYRRSVMTKNKLKGLAKITKTDCEFIEDLMTRYSVYAHDQPLEGPTEIVQITEVSQDIAAVKEWLESFKTRSD